MVITLLRVVAPSNKQEAVLEILRSVIDFTWGVPGCLGCVCYEEPKREGAVLYMEQWETKEDLYRHIQSELFLRLISAMEMAEEAPEIRFLEVTNSMGMELIEALRTDLHISNLFLDTESATTLNEGVSLPEKRGGQPLLPDPFEAK
jgi:quinol monooxygenase YgiN